MKVKTFIVSPMETNGYVVFDENTLDGIVIDPGSDGNKFLEFIEAEKINLKYIVLTHAHFDHIGGVDEIKRNTGADIMLCKGEEVIAENCRYNLSAFHAPSVTVYADRILSDGEIVDFGKLSFKVFITPGHTPGGGCFYFEKERVLFTGDTLFFGSVGRTDFELGSMESLIASIKKKILVLPDEVIVYCGHGPKTSIGFEKKNNPFIYEDV